jgi:hypothetical protein
MRNDKGLVSSRPISEVDGTSQQGVDFPSQPKYEEHGLITHVAQLRREGAQRF